MEEADVQMILRSFTFRTLDVITGNRATSRLSQRHRLFLVTRRADNFSHQPRDPANTQCIISCPPYLIHYLSESSFKPISYRRHIERRLCFVSRAAWGMDDNHAVQCRHTKPGNIIIPQRKVGRTCFPADWRPSWMQAVKGRETTRHNPFSALEAKPKHQTGRVSRFSATHLVKQGAQRRSSSESSS